MSETVSKRAMRGKKRRFYGNQFTKLKRQVQLSEDEDASLSVSTTDFEENMSESWNSVSEPSPGKKRCFYGNQFTKQKIPSEHSEEEEASAPITDFEENINESWKSLSGSFNWRPYLRKPGFSAAPVSCFKHVALSNCWDSIVVNVRVEVRSPDCKNCCTTTPCCYWLATVIKVCGYWGLLRYDGFDKTRPHYFNVPDRWVNLCTEPHIHPIGWCSENGKFLVPPKSVEPTIICWKDFLMETMVGGRTLPPDFTFRIEEHTHNSIKKEMKLEVVDKNLISVVRSAIVSEVVGGRLHIKYADNDQEDEGFWCHERSPLIHPVGWAQIIGHALKAKPQYARLSLKKTLYRTFEPNDATWDMFLPVYNHVGSLKFKKGMKLEAIDPLNLSTICVATVTEVLRHNYLMIGIDGMMAANGSDCFCYHASSPCIFPVGFCDSHKIHLTPPRGYKGDFKWSEYLKKTKSEGAPVDLFHRDTPNHGFKEGMFLEAVDLMEPRLICVAYVTKVVGRLLKVHFDGWEEDYDQWCDCESPDLFPIGWCDVLGYRLEPPRVDGSEDKKKKKPIVKKSSEDKEKKKLIVKRSFKDKKKKKLIVKRRKKKLWSKRPSSSDESGDGENTAPNNPDGSKDPSRENSIILDDSNSLTGNQEPPTVKLPPGGVLKRGPKPKAMQKKKGNLKSSTLVDTTTAPAEKSTPNISAKKELRSNLKNPQQKAPKKVKRRVGRPPKSNPIITIEDDSSLSSLDVSAFLENEEWEN